MKLLLQITMLSLFMMAQGCTSLITPTVEKSVTELKAGNYKIDPEHSSVIFKVGHLGLSKYVGRFNQFNASLSFDPKIPEQTKLQATVNTGSIDVGDVDFEDSLQGSTWLESGQFPQAYFSSESIKLTHKNAAGQQQAKFCGQLTLLGVIKPLCFDVTFNGGAFNVLSASYTLGFAAHATFKRSDFGIDAYIPAVSDEVELEIHAEFLRN